MTDDLRTRIMAVLRERGWTCEYHEPVGDLGECPQCDDSHGNTADAVIRELPELAITITTAEQLDALPFLTVIREVRPPRRGIDYGGIYERRTSGWQCIAGTWVEPERNGPPMLPVVVLWRGKDTND